MRSNKKDIGRVVKKIEAKELPLVEKQEVDFPCHRHAGDKILGRMAL